MAAIVQPLAGMYGLDRQALVDQELFQGAAVYPGPRGDAARGFEGREVLLRTGAEGLPAPEPSSASKRAGQWQSGEASLHRLRLVRQDGPSMPRDLFEGAPTTRLGRRLRRRFAARDFFFF